MSENKYYVMRADFNEEFMHLDSMPDPSTSLKDNWMFGQAFTIAPNEPIIVDIIEGDEEKAPVPFYGNPQVASNEFIDALLEAGVDNLDLYDVILESEDEETQISGYKAFNIIGLGKELDNEKDEMNFEEKKELYMFRLEKSWRTIVVHEKVKNHLESKGFSNLDFTLLEDLILTDIVGCLC